jgi:hypothetical protein
MKIPNCPFCGGPASPVFWFEPEPKTEAEYYGPAEIWTTLDQLKRLGRVPKAWGCQTCNYHVSPEIWFRLM